MGELAASACAIPLLPPVAGGREVAQPKEKRTLRDRGGGQRVRQSIERREVLAALQVALRLPKRRADPGLWRRPFLELFLHGTTDTRVPS